MSLRRVALVIAFLTATSTLTEAELDQRNLLVVRSARVEDTGRGSRIHLDALFSAHPATRVSADTPVALSFDGIEVLTTRQRLARHSGSGRLRWFFNSRDTGQRVRLTLDVERGRALIRARGLGLSFVSAHDSHTAMVSLMIDGRAKSAVVPLRRRQRTLTFQSRRDYVPPSLGSPRHLPFRKLGHDLHVGLLVGPESSFIARTPRELRRLLRSVSWSYSSAPAVDFAQETVIVQKVNSGCDSLFAADVAAVYAHSERLHVEILARRYFPPFACSFVEPYPDSLILVAVPRTAHDPVVHRLGLQVPSPWLDEK